MQLELVITGGPCCGKTAVLDRISSKGFVIVPEAARAVIEDEQKKTDGILPWTDNYRFQLKTPQRQTENELLYEGDPRFLDRTASVEGWAYSMFHKNTLPSEVERAAYERRYSEILVLEQLPRAYYKTDAQRKETYEQSCELSSLILQAYQRVGYNPVFVPTFVKAEGATPAEI